MFNMFEIQACLLLHIASSKQAIAQFDPSAHLYLVKAL